MEIPVAYPALSPMICMQPNPANTFAFPQLSAIQVNTWTTQHKRAKTAADNYLSATSAINRAMAI
jgi:hypothetical protein